MPRKPKFKPVITRVKLNPEQAVLSCACYQFGGYVDNLGIWRGSSGFPFCNGRSLNIMIGCWDGTSPMQGRVMTGGNVSS